MALTAATNFTSGNAFTYATADGDDFDRDHLNLVAQALDNHTHAATLGLGVARLAASVLDSNANEIFKITSTASAVNEWTLANAATGTDPLMSATGGDTNIGLAFQTKGTGVVTFESVAAGTTGSVVNLLHDGGSAADDDDVAIVRASGDDDGNNETIYGEHRFVSVDVTDTEEDGKQEWWVMKAGTNTNHLTLDITALSPSASDLIALGTTSLMWSDLFLASGAVANFNNGDMTITHSAGNLKVAGSTAQYAFDVETSGDNGGAQITSTSAGAGGAQLAIYGNSASAANADTIGRIQFYGRNADNSTKESYAAFIVALPDASQDAEDASMSWHLFSAGSNNIAMNLTDVGVLSVDLAGSGSAAQVDLFDDYEDYQLARRFRHWQQDPAVLDIFEQHGILERKDTGSGWMMSVPGMINFQLDAIYQLGVHLKALTEQVAHMEAN